MKIFGHISGALALAVIFVAFVQVIMKKSKKPMSPGEKFADVVFFVITVVILAAILANVGSVILALIG